METTRGLNAMSANPEPTAAAPTPASVRVVILGAGMSGICMGIQLRKQGIDDFIILEKAESVGGTWRENTYPGVTCDAPSPVHYLSGPWTWTWTYQRKPGYKMYEYVCEDNREFADPVTGVQRMRFKDKE